MPPIKFHDAAGVPIQFLEVDGVLYPYPDGAQDDSIRVKRDIPGRDDDVLLVSYSKAGQYVTQSLIASTPGPELCVWKQEKPKMFSILVFMISYKFMLS